MARNNTETYEQFLARIVALDAAEAEDQLDTDDQILRIRKKKEIRDQVEADRKAKAEADRKAKEELDRKAKEQEKRRAKTLTGSPQKDEDRKKRELENDSDEEAQPYKKSKITPCDNCLKKSIECTPAKKGGRGTSCASCQATKVKCERSSESDGATGFEMLDEKLSTDISLLHDIRGYQKMQMVLAHRERAESALDHFAQGGERSKGKGKGRARG
ncbi:hypothetical protein DFH06DRAFT_1243004 [Mycena polygramma]|nr:hypothetical protein DFH06DRAFT_1243004 [Mycena polygramma]